MEGIKVLSFKNEADTSKDVIILPFHFVEEIGPNHNLIIHFYSTKHKEEPVFDLEIKDREVLVELNFDISDIAKHSIIVYINDKQINKFEW